MNFESAKKQGFIASTLFISIYIASFAISLSCIPLLMQAMINPLGVTSLVENYLIGICAATAYILIAGLIALILFLLAHYRLSKYYKEPAIFRNIIYSIIITIIYTIIITTTATILAITLFTTTAIDNFQLPMQNSLQTGTAPEAFIIFVAAIIITAIPVAIINGILWWRAFTKLGEKSNIQRFKTTGLLFFIGIFIGIANLIAWIFAATCYKQLQPNPNSNTTDTTNHTPPTTQTSPPNFDKNHCTYCGTENNNTTYCKHCGNPIQTTQTNP